MIETHDACARLGVDKRRLRDFIVILESIGLLKKERKNHYSWKGFGVLPKTFQLLQRGGLGESYTRLEDDEVSQVVEDGRGGKLDNRKENCIELLTQKFVKLFLCSELELISIDEAAILLNGDAQDPSLIQTKVKRLYDIANVLASMNIIQKTYQPETKRFVFRWIGIRGEAEMATTNDLALKTKRRTIENEATDTSAKRHMGDQSSKGTTSQTVVAPSQTPCEGRSPKKVVENDLEKGSIPDIEKHRFGPSAPKTVPQDKPKSKNNIGTQIQDWESLALTHRPQYHQHQGTASFFDELLQFFGALRDLFSHYRGAWNNYHSEVAGKDPAQP
uniref:E2F/DP family winged-helix DNA-binding domain-containing protein n=1 Tax=Daucus carota subsp. sativus TaxID=79200 RepID=A0A164VMX5_DAUCS